MRSKILVTLLMSAVVLAACAGATATPAEPSPLPPITATLPPDSVATHEPGDIDSLPLPSPESPFAPQPGDAALQHGPVFLDATELLQLESYPVQIVVHLQGSLPSPCHQLRVKISGPDAQNQIQLEVYSRRADPNQACADVLSPIDEGIALGSFPTGKYTVWVNGVMIGEFNS